MVYLKHSSLSYRSEDADLSALAQQTEPMSKLAKPLSFEIPANFGWKEIPFLCEDGEQGLIGVSRR
jgi:hypothetical protein